MAIETFLIINYDIARIKVVGLKFQNVCKCHKYLNGNWLLLFLF